MHLKTEKIITKPIPGDLLVVKKTIDVADTKGNILSLKKNEIIRLVAIKDLNPSIRLDRKTKFIANWQCRFIHNNRLFDLHIQNNSNESMFFAHFEPLTEELAKKLSPANAMPDITQLQEEEE